MAGRGRKKRKSSAKTIKEAKRVPMALDEFETQSDLPTEILELIFSRLALEDNVRASAVSKTWLAAAISVRKANKPPWLMFFPKSSNFYELYDPSERKMYCLELPELRGSRICYAKDGWLLVYRPRTLCIFLFCPYTQELIILPRIQLVVHQTVAFSAAPTSPSCVLVTIRPLSLSVVSVSTCRPGATRWATRNYGSDLAFDSSVWNKQVFCQGHLYCLSLTGRLGIYNPYEGTWMVVSVPLPRCIEGSDSWWNARFMAEHKGDIFVVYTCAASKPIAYILNQRNKVWVEIEDLREFTLFASPLLSEVRSDLLGNMRGNIYFPKVQYYGKRCVTYSPYEGRYFPRKMYYDWEKQDPFESIWIEAPEDLSTIL